ADLLGIGQQRGDVAVFGLGGGVLAAVEQGEAHVGILGRGLEDGVGVLVTGGVDEVIAQLAVSHDGLIVVGLADAVGDLGGPAVLGGGVHHGVVAAHTPAAVGDAGVADHGDLVFLGGIGGVGGVGGIGGVGLVGGAVIGGSGVGIARAGDQPQHHD